VQKHRLITLHVDLMLTVRPIIIFNCIFSIVFFSKMWPISQSLSLICSWFSVNWSDWTTFIPMCTCSAVFIQKNKNIHSLSKWKIRVSRFLLLKIWKTNLWKWRYPISRTLTYKINCLVMAPRRPMCVCVGLQAMKQGQLKNIFAVLYEWLTPLNCVY
jgi:hypothetical protein